MIKAHQSGLTYCSFINVPEQFRQSPSLVFEKIPTIQGTSPLWTFPPATL